MIILDKPRLKFLLAGRAITITIPRARLEYRRHHHYSLGLAHNKPAICRVLILNAEHTDTDWTLTIRQAAIEQPRLLRKKGGYTSNPAQAMDIDEPEAVDEATQERLTELGTLHWQQLRDLRHAQQVTISLRDRLAQLELLAAAGDQQAKRHLHVIQQRLDTAERQRAA